MVRSEACGTARKSKDNTSSNVGAPRRKGKDILDFAKRLLKVKVEQERRLDLEALASRNIQPMIDLMGWGRLVRMQGTYNLTMVTEFLAAAHPEDLKDGKGVMVRGKKVKFTPKAINEFYGTPSFSDNPNYHHRFSFPNPPEANLTEDFMEEIWAYPQGDWVTGASKVNHKELTTELTFWNLFARHNIIPAQKNQELSDLNAKVIKSIARQQPFDLGDVMCQHLTHECFKQYWGRIIYPHLITALCERAQVPARPEDQYGESGHPIDDREYKIIIKGRDDRAYDMEGIPRPGLSKYKRKKLHDTEVASRAQGGVPLQQLQSV